MNRRNFLKGVGIAGASIPSSMLGDIKESFITTIDLTNIDSDASLYILKENSAKPIFSGLMKDYKPLNGNGYNYPILLRVRKVGYKPYEFNGVGNIRPVLIKDIFYENSLL